MSANTENSVKMDPTDSAIFWGYANFCLLPKSEKKKFSPRNRKLLDYMTEVHQVFTRCRATKPLIHTAIMQSILECQGAKYRWVRDFAPNLVAMAASLEG